MAIVAHQKPIVSPIRAKSTAAEVAANYNLIDKTAVVTGGYSGIGVETVKALADKGARIIVPARRPDVARKALDDIGSSTANIDIVPMDLADLDSIKKGSGRNKV